MRMAVVNAVDGVSGNTANGLVWAFQTKVGWEMQNYVMTKVSMLQTRSIAKNSGRGPEQAKANRGD